MKISSPALPLALLSALVLSACGGGGGGTSASSTPTTSTTTQSATLNGVVQGKGSVVINGVRCSTTGTNIRDEDNNRFTTDDIQLGYVASADCTYDTSSRSGKANSILLKREFSGPIDTVGNNGFVLLGQTILVDSNTVFSGDDGAQARSLADLASGDFVEVYGLPTALGEILATHVEKDGSFNGLQSGVEGRGTVSNLNTTTRTFQIGQLTVDYSTASNAASLSLQDGQFVRFRSSNLPDYSAAGSSATLQATLVQVKSVRQRVDPSGRGEVELKGYVDSDAGDTNNDTFTLDGITVDIGALRASEKALFTASDKPLLEVEGRFNGDVLVAREAERENDRSSRNGGRIEFYGVATNGAFANGQLTFTVQNNQVVFNRDVCGISSGTPYVEVKGTLSNGVINATKVECENDRNGNSSSDDDREFGNRGFELSGIVSGYSQAARQFTLKGVTVQITNATRFEDGNESTLGNGRRVEVKGALDANQIMQADKIEFEDD